MPDLRGLGGLSSLSERVRRARASRAFVIRVAAVGLGVIQSIVVARLGGPELRGVVAVFVSACSLIYLAASFDLGAQVVSMCRERGTFSPLAPLLNTAWAVYSVIAGLITVAFLTIDSAVSWLAIGTLAYLIGSQAAVVIGALRGAVASSWVALVQQSVLLAGMLGIAWAGLLGDSGVKAVMIVSFLVPLPIFWLLPHVGSEGRPPMRDLARDVGRAAVGGFPWQLGRTLQWSVILMDTILVAHYLGDAAAGVYAVGFSLTMVPRLVSGQVATDLYHRAAMADEHTLDRDLRQSLIGTLGVTVAVAVVAPLVINVFYGAAFAQGLTVYLVLSVSMLAQAALQVSYQFTRVYGTPWPTVGYGVVGPVLMLALAPQVLPAMGVVGMAWISGAASIVMAIPATLLARRQAHTASL